MEMEQVLELIKTISDSPLTEFEYDANGVKIALKKEQSAVVMRSENVAFENLEHETAKSAEKAGNIVKSPLVGTFYAAPAEDAKAFVKVGDMVSEGQVLAIVEAMKLMNEIESEYSGRVAEIFVKNGDVVEYAQPLFRIV